MDDANGLFELQLLGKSYRSNSRHRGRSFLGLTILPKSLQKCSGDADEASLAMMGSIYHRIVVATENLPLILSHQGRKKKKPRSDGDRCSGTAKVRVEGDEVCDEQHD